MRQLCATILAAVVFAAAPYVFAETLLIERVNEEASTKLPARGMRMTQVERTFGAPAQRLDPRGGQSRKWPTINRWTYPNFVVYFEKDRVIDAVAIRAGANEVGPKPPIK